MAWLFRLKMEVVLFSEQPQSEGIYQADLMTIITEWATESMDESVARSGFKSVIFAQLNTDVVVGPFVMSYKEDGPTKSTEFVELFGDSAWKTGYLIHLTMKILEDHRVDLRRVVRIIKATRPYK